MTTASDWVAEVLAMAPEPIRSAMRERLAQHSSDPIPEALTRAAIAEYATVLAGAGGREDAFPLLVADALLTHAFQAEAELSAGEPSGVERIWNEGLAELVQRTER